MISLVIPTLRKGSKLEQFLHSVRGQYDEVIIVDDQIDNLAVKINKGLTLANGEHIIVSNDDVILESGTLSQLCCDKVVSPKVIGGVNKDFHAHIFCLPREIYEKTVGTVKGWSDYGKVGYYEGFYRFYWDDSDYWMKLLSNGFVPEINESVVVKHEHPGWTLNTFEDKRNTENFNRSVFAKRWGEKAIQKVV